MVHNSQMDTKYVKKILRQKFGAIFMTKIAEKNSQDNLFVKQGLATFLLVKNGFSLHSLLVFAAFLLYRSFSNKIQQFFLNSYFCFKLKLSI
jgi:hypothetical protein